MKNKHPRLDIVLAYKNNDVVKRYMRDYKVTRYFAERMFKEMLKFLWLANLSKNKKSVKVSMYVDMDCIDNMWHTFILFTRPYTDFCDHYFGYYIHHVPETKKMKNKDDDEEFQAFFDFAYDHLGRQTLLYWFKPSHKNL